MAYLIKHAHVFAPEDLGERDVLVVGEHMLAVDKDLSCTLPDLEVIDAKGKLLTPGFFDQHIHVTGGGGEAGPVSRPPELMLSELIRVGTTSGVGVLGTDFVSRSVENLLAKVRALKSEGVSAWMYTSNYHYPPTTLTGSVPKDLYFVPEVLGCKIALGDHRSSFPDLQSVLSLLTDVRVGGMISGKLGVLHVHSGDIPGAFDMYDEIVKRGFPIRHIRPTHCSRIEHVFNSSVEFALKGGYVDYTSGAGTFCGPCALSVKKALDAGVDPAHITMSTDGHGSMPKFNDKGVMVGMGVCGVEGNFNEMVRLVKDYDVPLATALRFITSSPADALALKGYGHVAKGMVANLCLLNQDLEIEAVMSRGRLMMRDKELLVKGTFEE